MSRHTSTLVWNRSTPDFKTESYDRTHKVTFEGGQSIHASSAPDYLGNAKFANPEELLVAALSSCHMLTFLAVAAKSGFTVDSYEDHAIGTLEKGPDGKVWVTQATLHPKTKFSGDLIPDMSKLKELHERAHRNCFVANSIKTHVETILE